MHGIFVETRLRHLLTTGEVETQVVAPVPWFPFSAPIFGEYAAYAATPAYEERHGIKVHHPRYPVLPKIGMNRTPFDLARAALPTIRKMIADGFDFDLIDAHYYYPDGIAAMLTVARTGAGDPNGGQTENLDAITAVVLGGTSLFGGRGIILGTLVGAMIVGVFRNGLTLMGVSSVYQILVTGILVILAVATDQMSRKGAR